MILKQAFCQYYSNAILWVDFHIICVSVTKPTINYHKIHDAIPMQLAQLPDMHSDFYVITSCDKGLVYVTFLNLGFYLLHIMRKILERTIILLVLPTM